ncbi:HNH/ENDO VII family nuclease [Oceanirhabdus seepicola]|uniref:HNH/ENDO VII family nuclease n=1 Tax=Oceanirhabdus seepicola TaxID=2828781 RepID=A0A9J6P3E2_9CLOT|nr:HNH/ENDO VII family nuclease [Oceanirhabdus seepicola]MCM1991322.1 HNH/ENDO VII family nuclease [Oceanirhabdus seepicola]
MAIMEIAKVTVGAIEKAAEVTKNTVEVVAKTSEKCVELGKKGLDGVVKGSGSLLENIDVIKNKSLSEIRLLNNDLLQKLVNDLSESVQEATEVVDKSREGLTEKERKKIKEETGWSDEIVNNIDSWEQYEIYKDAELQEGEINGRKCLLKDIDLDYVDEKTGKTNLELMEQGRSPIDSKTGEKIELHHMGQQFDGPFVELAENSEHGGSKHSILHPNREGSFRNDPELVKQYNRERAAHWKSRV